MGMLRLELSISLDGFAAGPEPSLEEPLGIGGERLHEWLLATSSFRERHGLQGGERNADDELVAVALGDGATIMGRRMFSGGSGPWDTDTNPDGWWGDEPPFHHPVFVLT